MLLDMMKDAVGGELTPDGQGTLASKIAFGSHRESTTEDYTINVGFQIQGLIFLATSQSWWITDPTTNTNICTISDQSFTVKSIRNNISYPSNHPIIWIALGN